MRVGKDSISRAVLRLRAEFPTSEPLGGGYRGAPVRRAESIYSHCSVLFVQRGGRPTSAIPQFYWEVQTMMLLMMLLMQHFTRATATGRTHGRAGRGSARPARAPCQSASGLPSCISAFAPEDVSVAALRCCFRRFRRATRFARAEEKCNGLDGGACFQGRSTVFTSFIVSLRF